MTAHEEYGERSKKLIEMHSPDLVTSTLTLWLLHVLTKLENLDEILSELGIGLLPLTDRIFRRARLLKRPRDYEDRLHLATMEEHGIKKIVSNDEISMGYRWRIFERSCKACMYLIPQIT